MLEVQTVASWSHLCTAGTNNYLSNQLPTLELQTVALQINSYAGGTSLR